MKTKGTIYLRTVFLLLAGLLFFPSVFADPYDSNTNDTVFFSAYDNNQYIANI